MKSRLIGIFTTFMLLMGLISMMVVPAMAEGGNVVYFTPDPAEAPECGQNVEVTLVAQIDTDNAATTADIIFTFDNTCLEITNVVDNTADWQGGIYYSDIPELNANGEMHIAPAVGKNPPICGAIPVVTLSIRCIECGPACASSTLDLTEATYWDEFMMEVHPTLDDGEFNCGAKELVSVDLTYSPKDEFAPGEGIYVQGTGFTAGQDYMIYIEPYMEGIAVMEGQPLDPAGGTPLGYPMPIIVPAAGDGSIGPVYLATPTAANIDTYWEIVADDMTSGIPGVYNAAEDGLDAIALDEAGFHVVPEALTIILLGAGLAGLGGYMVVRRRKTANRDV
jgi:hypothetical protein